MDSIYRQASEQDNDWHLSCIRYVTEITQVIYRRHTSADQSISAHTWRWCLALDKTNICILGDFLQVDFHLLQGQLTSSWIIIIIVDIHSNWTLKFHMSSIMLLHNYITHTYTWWTIDSIVHRIIISPNRILRMKETAGKEKRLYLTIEHVMCNVNSLVCVFVQITR